MDAMSESAKISRVGLPMPHLQINYEVLLNFQSNLTSQRFTMLNFTLKYLEEKWFSWIFFVFEMQKGCFPWLSVFFVLCSISVIFLCFAYRGKLATLTYRYQLKKIVCWNLAAKWWHHFHYWCLAAMLLDPLVLCCDWFDRGSSQVKRDPVDLVTDDYDVSLCQQIKVHNIGNCIESWAQWYKVFQMPYVTICYKKDKIETLYIFCKIDQTLKMEIKVASSEISTSVLVFM